GGHLQRNPRNGPWVQAVPRPADLGPPRRGRRTARLLVRPERRDHGQLLRRGPEHRRADTGGPAAGDRPHLGGRVTQATPSLDRSPGAGTQLALTVFAVILSVGAYVLVTLGKTGKAPPGITGFVIVIAGSYLAAHLLVTRLAPGADPVLLPTAAVLAGL